MTNFLLVVLAFSLGILITYYYTKWHVTRNSDKLKDEFSWFRSKNYNKIIDKINRESVDNKETTC